MLTVTPFVSGDGPDITAPIRNSGAFVRIVGRQGTAMAEWAGGYSAFYDITDREAVYDMLRRPAGRAAGQPAGSTGSCSTATAALPYARSSQVPGRPSS